MRKPTSFFAAVLLVQVLFVSQGNLSTGGGWESDGSWSGPDLSQLADLTGLPEEELALEQSLIDEMSSLSENLESHHGFTSLWITWEPFQLHASFTPDADDRLLELLDGFSRQDLLIRHTSRVTATTLGEILHRAVAIRDAWGLEADVTVEAQEERVHLIVLPADVADFAERIAADEHLHQAIQADTLVIHQGEVSAPTTGGGGHFTNGCSAAFIVIDNYFNYGVLGAGHIGCGGNTTYVDWGTSYSTYQAFNSVQGARDMSIQRLYSGTPVNVVRIGESPWDRYITSTNTWASLVVGQSACIFAKQNNTWKCAQIEAKNVAPSYVPSSHSFIRMSNTCQPGDSGGAWFIGFTALGIQSGRYTSNHKCIWGSISHAMAGTEWFVKTNP